MCGTTIVTSPVGPVAGRVALGVGAVAGLPLAAQLVPEVTMYLAGALAVMTVVAVVATAIAIRFAIRLRRAKAAAAEAPPPPPAPQRAYAEILAARPLELPAAEPEAAFVVERAAEHHHH